MIRTFHIVDSIFSLPMTGGDPRQRSSAAAGLPPGGLWPRTASCPWLRPWPGGSCRTRGGGPMAGPPARRLASPPAPAEAIPRLRLACSGWLRPGPRRLAAHPANAEAAPRLTPRAASSARCSWPSHGTHVRGEPGGRRPQALRRRLPGSGPRDRIARDPAPAGWCHWRPTAGLPKTAAAVVPARLGCCWLAAAHVRLCGGGARTAVRRPISRKLWLGWGKDKVV